MDIIRIVLALFLPPVAVFLTVGLGLHFWLNLLLTLCFFLPGVVHALWVVMKK
ncbi:MAG: YqaE/Pmp3 family membrane protein [Alphaproteobacteria bacterium]